MNAANMVKTIGILLFIIAYWPAYTQHHDLRFEHITAEKGLPSNTAIRIIQDQKGYIWVGTYNGLCKYDGYNFTTYQFDPDDTTSIAGNMIYNLWESKDGIIWVVARGTGLYTFNRATEKFTRFQPTSGSIPIEINQSYALNEDNEGCIWISDSEGGLGRYDKQTGQFFNENYISNLFGDFKTGIPPKPIILQIIKDQSGTLWFRSYYGLHKLSLTPQANGRPSIVQFTFFGNDPQILKEKSEVHLLPLCEDREGMLWFSIKGLHRFNPRTGTFTRYVHDPKNSNSLYSNNVTGIAEDQQGNLWISTDNVLNKLNKERTLFTRYEHDANHPSSINGSYIYSLFLDSSDILWLATIDGGLEKVDLNQNRIAHYRHHPSDLNSLSSNKVTAICEDRFGTVWIGTLGGGLNAWNQQTNTFTHKRYNPLQPYGLQSDLISAILEDQNGTLWIGGGKDSIAMLSKLNRKNNTFQHYFFRYHYQNTNGNPVLTLYEDRYGFIWIGTTGGVICFNPKTETWIHYGYDPKNPNSVSDYWANTICEDNRGNIWIGHNSNALDKLNPTTGIITHYVHRAKDKNSISSNIVKSIYKDLKGVLWFATRHGGLCQLNEKDGTFSTYTKKDGLPSNTLYAILEDGDGYLWLTTNKGLSRFSPATQSFTNFDVHDGLQGNEFEIRPENAGGCFKGRDGTLYFGGPNGLNAFHPRALHTNKTVPPVVITRFALFDKSLPGKNEAGEIVLNYDKNFISFEFAALNYSNPAKNQYAYQLAGVDMDWVYSGNRRLASYTNINPGNYIFKVKASNNDGIWNEQGTSIRIIILPPWWRTWWAYFLYIFLFGGIIYLLLRSYMQYKLEKQRMTIEKLQAIEQERMRISSELHDDIGGELSTIRLLSEINVPKADPQVRLSKISASSSDLVQKMNEIVWALNINNDSLQSLISYIRLYAVKFLDDVQINCCFEQPSIIPDCPLDGTIRRNIFLLVKEALNNIVKHAQATNVNIAVAINGELYISIHDNGKGISEMMLKNSTGNGLNNMQQRIKELNGHLEIKNGAGTTVQIHLPLLKNHTKV